MRIKLKAGGAQDRWRIVLILKKLDKGKSRVLRKVLLPNPVILANVAINFRVDQL
jgi:hypothetical protein